MSPLSVTKREEGQHEHARVSVTHTSEERVKRRRGRAELSDGKVCFNRIGLREEGKKREEAREEEREGRMRARLGV